MKIKINDKEINTGLDSAIEFGSQLFKAAKPEFENNVKHLNKLLTYARKNPDKAGMTGDELRAINRYLSRDKSPATVETYKKALQKLKQVKVSDSIPEQTSVPIRERINSLSDSDFENYVSETIPEADHFPNLTKGATPEYIRDVVDLEFESLPKGARIDLGPIFSGESTAYLLPRIWSKQREGRVRVYMHPDQWILTNAASAKHSPERNVKSLRQSFAEFGVNDFDLASIAYLPETNQYRIPKMSVIKVRRKGGKLKLIKRIKNDN